MRLVRDDGHLREFKANMLYFIFTNSSITDLRLALWLSYRNVADGFRKWMGRWMFATAG